MWHLDVLHSIFVLTACNQYICTSTCTVHVNVFSQLCSHIHAQQYTYPREGVPREGVPRRVYLGSMYLGSMYLL